MKQKKDASILLLITFACLLATVALSVFWWMCRFGYNPSDIFQTGIYVCGWLAIALLGLVSLTGIAASIRELLRRD